MTASPYAQVALTRDGLPAWLVEVAEVADAASPEQLSRFVPPGDGGRDSAVLLLFAGDGGPGYPGPGSPGEVLLIQRAATLTSHPGQPAFPGGATDPGDGGPVGTAVRETVEETGLDPRGVQPFATLPQLFLPVSDFVVTPVLAWWRVPSPVRVVDPAEVSSVHRVRLDDLVDPANRVRVAHPSGYLGPAFRVDGLVVWGFTAGVLARLFALLGWERRWDESAVVPLPALPRGGG